MTNVVWKKVLEAGRQKVEMPCGANILIAREQGDDVVIWFQCDPSQPIVERDIMVVGTGYEFDIGEGESVQYIGMAHLKYKGYIGAGTWGIPPIIVLHVFEVLQVSTS